MSADTLPPLGLTRPGVCTIDRDRAQRLTGGTWHGQGAGSQVPVLVYGACIDSRRVQPGCLFACLTGSTHDGHDFAATAVGDGAAMVLASRPLDCPVPVLVVANVERALGQLSGDHRRRCSGVTWIGVTGSNGKTTVKDLIAAACSPLGRVHATHGNLNNALGVPLSILALPEDAAVAVIEMGANHPGEIAQLAAMARPHVGVITSLGPAHLEGFGDLFGVARAKSELFAALDAGAPALLGTVGLEETCAPMGVDPAALLSAVRRASVGRDLRLVGSASYPVRGDATADGIDLQVDAGQVHVCLLGAHNLANVALAYYAAVAAGAPAEGALAGLAAMAAVPGRLVPRACNGHLVIDDSYNANPASMAAALRVLAGYSTRTLAILGPMGELGLASEAGHRQVGETAARLKVSLVTVGEQARPIFLAYQDAGGTDAVHALDRAQALDLVQHRLQMGPTTLLVKASRQAGLEWIVSRLLGEGGTAT